MSTVYPLGVSSIVCCHNSAARLAPTLDHLAGQQCSPDLPWEVIVVDNASTDGTAEVARNLWPADCAVPLRVVREEKLGLSHARARGLSEARYECITFVDDDNWLCPDWVQTVADTFNIYPEVGMLSGRGEAVFECPAPWWFSQCERSFVVGAPADSAGFIRPRLVCGAGMCLRHSAWDALGRIGFEFLLTDRRGNSLSSSGDVELMLAMSFMGWKAWYEPRLQFRHWLPATRLTTSYMRRLSRAIGMASVPMTLYLSPTSHSRGSLLYSLRRRWVWHLQREVRGLIYSVAALALAWVRGRALEGVPAMEWSFGRLLGLALTGPLRFRAQQRSVERLYCACTELKRRGLTGGVARKDLQAEATD
jgi:glycosyltransferase involved in cell wall biosynthesis